MALLIENPLPGTALYQIKFGNEDNWGAIVQATYNEPNENIIPLMEKSKAQIEATLASGTASAEQTAAYQEALVVLNKVIANPQKVFDVIDSRRAEFLAKVKPATTATATASPQPATTPATTSEVAPVTAAPAPAPAPATNEVTAAGSGGTVGTGSAAASAAGSTAPTNTNPDAEQNVNIPNPLHAYPSYTYSLSLHLLSSKDWNNIQNGGKYVAKNVLIASAGRYDNSVFIRNKNFTDDFYFDDFKMTSVIAPTEGNPASNGIDFSFTIIEPYGVTLLDRIIDANNELDPPEQNYINSVYLIQIDFYGADDAGNIVHPLPNMTKYIPVHLTGMDISVNVKGAEYKFTASPYGHDALTQTVQQTPAHFEITATTVKDFFASNVSETYQKEYEENQRLEAEQLAAAKNTELQYANAADETSVISPVLMSNTVYSKGSIYKSKSYGSAVNAWNTALKKTNDLAEPDLIDFVFDDEIGNAKLVEEKKLPPKDAPMADISQRQAIAKEDISQLAADLDFNTRTYAVNTGTTVESILTYVIKNSAYIRNQITNPADFNGDLAKYLAAKKNLENEPFWWFKIVPQIRLLNYDPIRKRRARQIIYYVKKYAIRNLKVDFGPGGLAQKPLKVYNYIYTGKNDDIIEFDIKFNTAFYTAVTANTSKLITDSGAPDANEADTKVKSAEQKRSEEIQPNHIVPVVGDQSMQATGGALTGKAVLAGDTVRSILTNAGGDMINVKLKIIGDPLFIKQDDLFYPPKINQPIEVLTENNSIQTDNGEIHVQLSFKTPADRDESTGGVRYYDPKYSTSAFSGMYKVLMVESEFSRGQFIQSLDLIRLPNQLTIDYTTSGAKDSSTAERSTDSTTPPLSVGFTPTDTTIGSPLLYSDGNVPAIPESTQLSPDFTPISVAGNQVPGERAITNDLASIAATAPEQSITSQTEPDLVAPNFNVA